MPVGTTPLLGIPASQHARSFFLVSDFYPSLAGTLFSFLSRHASPRQHARVHALRTHRRPTTKDTTSGSPAWLTGRLQKGETRSVRSPRRRPPLLATPIATPFQGDRPPLTGPTFCFLSYLIARNVCLFRAYVWPP